MDEFIPVQDVFLSKHTFSLPLHMSFLSARSDTGGVLKEEVEIQGKCGLLGGVRYLNILKNKLPLKTVLCHLEFMDVIAAGGRMVHF